MQTLPPTRFHALALTHGLLVDLAHDEYPTQVFGFHDDDLALAGDATHYGFVTEGEVMLARRDTKQVYRLQQGQFFVLPGAGHLSTFAGRGMVISRLGYQGLFQVGGPLEERGRLRYIDGCSDTLLVCPPVIGEPCLNHLHLPPGTNQTAHTHPSQRIGVILHGRGICKTPDGVHELEPGLGWWIPTGVLHSFFTPEDSDLEVTAWHPDSDFGPQHDNHPMINRTYVNDVSAREIDAIRTAEIGG